LQGTGIGAWAHISGKQKAEFRRIIDQLSGVYQVMTRLLYGTGMRLMESGALGRASA
jgi:integrase